MWWRHRTCVTSDHHFHISLGNSGLCWTVFARNRDITVPAEGNGDLQTLICVLVARPRRCLTLSNPVPWQNWVAAYLGYTLRMNTLFCGWPVMAHETHTRRRRLPPWSSGCNMTWNLSNGSFKVTENGIIRKLGYGFLLAFQSNYGSILCIIYEINRDTGRRSWFVQCPYTMCIWCASPPDRGGSPRLSFCLSFSSLEKSCGWISMKIFLGEGVTLDREQLLYFG